MRRDDRTPDLFAAAYPVRRPKADLEAMSFDARLRRAISQALKEAPESRERIAARMGELLGEPQFSAHMLNAYTAESRVEHNISVKRFMALVRASGAIWLLDFLAEEQGCTVLQGEETRHAELGRLTADIEHLRQRARELRAALKAPARGRGPSDRPRPPERGRGR